MPNFTTLNQNPDGTIGRCISLPSQTEATALFENYATQVDYIYRILHLPTVRTRLEELYASLARGDEVDPGTVALFLSIFANSAYFWTPRGCIGHLFSSVREATRGALLWSKTALDVMNHLDRTMSGGIEDVQARMILVLLVYNFEGISTVTRCLHASALMIARSLHLHRTDCSKHEKETNFKESIIETEVKRRVWWHLTTTDW